jgi:hypothetical protein
MWQEDRASSAVGRGWAAAFGVHTKLELEGKMAQSGEQLEWLGGDTVGRCTLTDFKSALEVPGFGA